MGRGQQIPFISNKVYRDQLVTIADLETFKEELLISLIRLIKEHSNKSTKRWLKAYEVREMLHISNGTLHSFRHNGTIPFTKIGNITYYSLDDIERVMEEKKISKTIALHPKKVKTRF